MDNRIAEGEAVIVLGNMPRLLSFVAYSGRSALLANERNQQVCVQEAHVMRHSLYNAIDAAKARGFDRVLYRGQWLTFERFIQRLAPRLRPEGQEFVFSRADSLITLQRRAASDFCGAWLCSKAVSGDEESDDEPDL